MAKTTNTTNNGRAKNSANKGGANRTANTKNNGRAKNDKITKVIYSKMQTAVDEIEKYFFTSKKMERFPSVLYAVNYSCSRGVVAYVRPNSLYDTDKKEVVQYLCINPSFLSRGLEYLLSTLVHELCHVYEIAYIHIPRGGYHTKEWAQLMEGCGLAPRYHNASRTSVDETIIEGGVFVSFVEYFTKKYGANYFNLTTHDCITTDNGNKPTTPADDGRPRADNADKPIKIYNRNKIKYTCAGCGAKVWGKANLHIICADCTAKNGSQLVMFTPDVDGAPADTKPTDADKPTTADKPADGKSKGKGKKK